MTLRMRLENIGGVQGLSSSPLGWGNEGPCESGCIQEDRES